MDAATRKHEQAVAALWQETPSARPFAGGRPVEITWTASGTATERGRATAFARHVARLAAASFEVRGFRRGLLGNPTATLAPEQARQLLRSPAVRYLSRQDFELLGVPVLGHDATVSERLLRPREEEKRDLQDGPWLEARLRLRSPSRRLRSLTRAVALETAAPLRLPGEPAVRVYPDSVLDGLLRTAQRLATRYGWAEGAAAAFLLTGKAPSIMPVQAGSTFANAYSEGRTFLPTAVITVRALPHVSPESVAAAFAREQKRLVGHRAGRPVQERNLRLLDFVSKQVAQSGAPPDWPSLMKTWNGRHKGKSGYGFPSRMRRDFESTAARVYLLDVREDMGMAEDRLRLLERVLTSLAVPDARPA